MNRQHPSSAAERAAKDDPASVAQSVRSDFVRLISIFDLQLKNATDGKAPAEIADARAAAERGVRLSEELIDLLREHARPDG